MDTDPESVAFLANTAVSSAAILRSVSDAAQRNSGQVYMREVRYPDSYLYPLRMQHLRKKVTLNSNT